MNISSNSPKFFVIALLFFSLLGCSGQQAGEGAHDEHEREEQHAEQSQSNVNDHGSRFRAVEVMTGTSDDGFVEIKLLEELPENTEVATKGAFFILSEMKKGEGGHHH